MTTYRDIADADAYLAQCCNNLSVARELLELATSRGLRSNQLHSAPPTGHQPEAVHLEQHETKVLTFRRRAAA